MNTAKPDQLTLGVSLDDDANFENFLVAPANQQAVSSLQDSECKHHYVYLWGSGSPGLTHLLQSACHQAAEANQTAIYIPLAEKDQFTPEILAGASSLALVCIDDVDQLDGDEAWELALFNAFNAIKESHTRLLVAAKTTPLNLHMQLPDLQSRLQSGLVYQIAELNDEEKLAALQLRARYRGMQLATPVAEFILLRAERSLTALMKILDQLDESSLQERRSLTIPLVKSTLGW